MKILNIFVQFIVIFLIFDGFFISKDYVIAMPLICIYIAIAYKLFIHKSSIFTFKGNIAFFKKDYEKA